MKGHDALLLLRRKGFVPAVVWLHDTDAPDRLRWPEEPRHAVLYVEPGDKPARLDLRCLVGLPVVVSFEEPERMRRTVMACEQAGAARVLGFAAGQAIDTKGDQSWRTC